MGKRGNFCKSSPCRALTNSQEQTSLQTPAIIILFPPGEKAAKINIFLLAGHPHPQGVKAALPGGARSLFQRQLGFLAEGNAAQQVPPQFCSVSSAHPKSSVCLGARRWQQLEKARNGTMEVSPSCPGVAAGEIPSESQGIRCIPSQALGNPPGLGSGKEGWARGVLAPLFG